MAQYQKPDWLTKHVFNPLVMLLTNRGLSVRGLASGGTRAEVRPNPHNAGESVGDRRSAPIWWRRVERPSGCGTFALRAG